MSTDKATKGRRARNNGIAFERRVAQYFGGERVPMSGAIPGMKGDVVIYGLQVQCKRTTALTTQRRWLDHDGSEILIQCNPRERVQDALVVMRASTFKRIMEAKNNELS
jgi:hypothetical protein